MKRVAPNALGVCRTGPGSTCVPRVGFDVPPKPSDAPNPSASIRLAAKNEENSKRERFLAGFSG